MAGVWVGIQCEMCNPWDTACNGQIVDGIVIE